MAGAPAGYDVVLSYGRADHAAANALRDRLTQEGKLRVFIDWRYGRADRAQEHWPLAAPQGPARPRPADGGSRANSTLRLLEEDYLEIWS